MCVCAHVVLVKTGNKLHVFFLIFLSYFFPHFCLDTYISQFKLRVKYIVPVVCTMQKHKYTDTPGNLGILLIWKPDSLVKQTHCIIQNSDDIPSV